MKKLYTLLILAGCSLYTYSQQQAVSFTLNQPISGPGHHYQALDYIDMDPGFEYEAQSPGEEFTAEINPLLVVPPDEGITGGPNPGDEGVVGALPAVVNVTELGAATYSIPLQLPPGIGNMAPQLAITYNSMMGNGLLGWGWTISGLSAISRTGSTIYHDNKVRGISFDEEDNLMLDGNRLIPVNEAGTEFRTEIESFSKIVEQQSNSYGPLWFEVRTKDGRILQFGNSTDSRHKLYGKQEVLSWYLNRIEDVKGNYIDFEYYQHNGEFRLNKVKYGGNWKTEQPHIYEIQLHVLAGRNDVNKVFISGGSMEMSVILGAITVKHLATDDFIYIYDLQYDWSEFYTRIIKIHLIDGEGKSLNPTSFIWQSTSNSVTQENVYRQIFNYSQRKFFLDIDGDGKTDYIELKYTNNSGNHTYHDWWIRKRTNSSFITISLPNQVNPLFHSLLVGDFNGDGLQDFITVKYTDDDRTHMMLDHLYTCTGSGYNTIIISDITINVEESDFVIGDFTGNGKDELAVLMRASNHSKIRLFSLENGLNLISETPYNFHNTTNTIPHILGDFTGNGKTNIITRKSSGIQTGTRVIEYNNELSAFQVIATMGFPTKDHRVLTGDFNGDGITDILTIAKKGTANRSWQAHMFDGLSAWIPLSTPDITPFDPEDQAESILNGINVADYNGDGKSDIIYIYKAEYHQNAAVKLYYSKGIGFSDPQIEELEWLGNIDLYGVVYNQKNRHLNIDFNGDGKSDLFRSFNYYYEAINYFTSQNSLDRISDISNGHGVNHSITYKPLTDNTIYTKGNSAVYPVMDIQAPIYVVYELEQELNGQHTNKIRYNYESAKVHKHGRGFLGFGKTEVNDLTNKFRTINEYSIYFPYYYTYLGSSTTYTTRQYPFKRLSKTSNILNFKTYNHPIVFFPYYSENFTLNWDNDINNNELFLSTSKQLTNYDDYGNPTTIIQLLHAEEMWIGSPHEDYDHTTTTEIVYYPPDLTNWLIGQPEIKTLTQVYEDQPEIISKESYKYFHSGEAHYPLLKEVSNFPNGVETDELALKTTFDYDDYGNRKKTTLNTINWTPELEKISAITYSVDYHSRFPTSFINPAGYEAISSYDDVYGWKTSDTDQNNLTTLYEHTPFRFNTFITNPDGTKQVNALRWAANHEDAPPDALYYSWNKISGTAEQLVFYNKTGHELRTVSIGFDGNKIYQTNEYNHLGRLKRTSLPYFPGDPIYYTTLEYDALGRVSKATYPDETTSLTSYLGNTIETTNHLQQTTKQTYNAAGWLVESEDAMGGKVNYDYFSDGKLKSSNIVGQPQTIVSLKYNSRRQRRELKDPNYGTATYEYNPFNELVEQVSPKNEISIYTYDILGRMLTQTEKEGTTEWIYDETTPRRIGTLQSMQYNSHQTVYVYDDLLRLTSATESINGDDYQTSYTYDEFGRVNTTTHPTGYAIKNIYNQHGYHTQIRSAQNNALLWQTDEVNAMGQITDFQTGNALLTSRIFEPETQRLTDVTTGISGQNPVQNYVYQWDEIGNLKERKTNIHNLVEFFTYDDLNRLETIKLNGTILGDHHYDPEGLGNLIYKKADGQELFNNAAYGENNDGPHALTSATTNTGVFPPDHQIIAYNSFDKAVSISEGSKQLQITYGHHRQRITQQYTDGSNTIDKVWAGACEYITENGQQKTLTYLSGPEGVFALHVKNPSGTENIRYIHKDHLGSWNTITDENGNLLQELSFDAWGNRRNPATWRAFTSTPSAALFDRGFTGHEHLYAFSLINMNGRMYDPLVSRMLSPDNFIQAPDFSQSFNRYSYCVNNPLKHTDPSGELFWIIPQIGYSKEGGLSVGISAVVGIPASVLSIQSGANYSFKSNDLSVYRGVSALGNTVYWGFSTASGYYIGYAFGLTPYSGVPVSTNFLSIGVHYNISHNSWSGNVSAMQVDQNGWTFNPSVSAMVFPEQTTNLTRGQGFRSNDAVLSRFVTAENHKGALDYFGFEGKYNPDLKSKRYQSEDYWGATNSTTGEISYGNLAFEDYSTLYGTYIKESYHSRKIQSGLSIEKLPSDLQGLGMDTYLEEIHGYVHAYKRQGLFSGHNMPFSGVKFYQSQLGMFGVPYPTYPSRFSWIYKVPRRW